MKEERLVSWFFCGRPVVEVVIIKIGFAWINALKETDWVDKMFCPLPRTNSLGETYGFYLSSCDLFFKLTVLFFLFAFICVHSSCVSCFLLPRECFPFFYPAQPLRGITTNSLMVGGVVSQCSEGWDSEDQSPSGVLSKIDESRFHFTPGTVGPAVL